VTIKRRAPGAEPDLAAVAIHEAGHAVIAHKLGIAVDSVTVRPHGDALGVMVPGSASCARDEAMVSLAGAIAEERYRGRPPRRGSDASDQKDVDETITALTNTHVDYGAILDDDYDDPDGLFRTMALDNLHKSKSPDALHRRLRRKTKALVEQNWEAITALARILIAEKTLTGARLTKLLQTLTKKAKENKP